MSISIPIVANGLAYYDGELDWPVLNIIFWANFMPEKKYQDWNDDIYLDVDTLSHKSSMGLNVGRGLTSVAE